MKKLSNILFLVCGIQFTLTIRAMENTIVVMSDENTEHNLVQAKLELAVKLVNGVGSEQNYRQARLYLEELITGLVGVPNRAGKEVCAWAHAYMAKIFYLGLGTDIDARCVNKHCATAMELNEELKLAELGLFLTILNTKTFIEDTASRNYFFTFCNALIRKYKDVVHLLVSIEINEAMSAENWAEGRYFKAAFDGTKEIVALQNELGVTVKTANKNGRTALHFATIHGKRELIELLLAQNAPINDVDKIGLSPLYWAILKGDTTTVELLLAHGADCKKVVAGWTALHFAAMNGDRKLIEILIAQGLNVDAAENGMSALHIALLKGNFEVSQSLRYYEAQVSDVSAEGWNNLHSAPDEDPLIMAIKKFLRA